MSFFTHSFNILCLIRKRVNHPTRSNAFCSLNTLLCVRGPDKMAASTTMPKGKYTESLTFSTLNCIYANYGKLGKPRL